MTDWNVRTIDIELDRKTVLKFRRDSFIISFGDEEGFGLDEAYLGWLKAKADQFPDGFVLFETANQTIGQLEMQVKPYEGEVIGYINMLYVIPEMRGKGFGNAFMGYAERFFNKQGVATYHLRVSPNNLSAIRFYQGLGMTKLKEEHLNYRVWRMKKRLD